MDQKEKNGLRGNKRNEVKGTKRVKECKVVTRHICCRPLEWACYGKNGKNAKKTFEAATHEAVCV